VPPHGPTPGLDPNPLDASDRYRSSSTSSACVAPVIAAAPIPVMKALRCRPAIHDSSNMDQDGNASSSENVTQVYQRISTPLAINRGVSGTLEAKVLIKPDRLQILFVNVRGKARELLNRLIY
jgi:hypothetical protein